MKPHTLLRFASATAILFTCATVPVFANHGGGGGFHGGGGGGFHGGGGFRSTTGGFSGGGFRGGSSSGPRMGTGFSRGTSGPPNTGSYERSGASNSRSYANPINRGQFSRGQRASGISSAPRAVADGQWHSFGNASTGRGNLAPQSEARSSARTTGGWQVFSGNRFASGGTHGVTRSFSGQGGDVWENAPVARNTVPASHALSTIRGSFASSVTGLRSGATLSASSGFAGGAVSGNREFSGSRFSNGFAGFRGNPMFGNSLNGFRGGFHGGCWNCGFRFGLGFGLWPGWGFGWPWFGYWDSGLYWNDPFWDWPGYGYYGYPSSYIYGYPYADASAGAYSDDRSNAPPEEYPDAAPSAPPADQSSSQANAAADNIVPVLLYLKDGTVYSARDYWVSGGQLHYILLNGTEGTIGVDQLDMQRSVDENARSGVRFTLKPSPSSFGPERQVVPETGPAGVSQRI